MLGCTELLTDLNKCVDSHDSHVGLTLCIVHQVEVDEFLQLQVISLHAVDNVREQSTAKQQHLLST